MEQIIENITKQLTSKLPDNTEFYTPEDLLAAGYPVFLVDWMKIEAFEFAAESVQLLKSEWINLKSDKAQSACHDFLEQLKSEITIPAAHITGMTQNGVEICLDFGVNPRRAIPEFIFRNDDELAPEELHERVSKITVNAHLAIALERYMIRKEKLTLKFGKAKQVVEAIDEKLTSGHNPLNWAEELKPVFALCGSEADPELLRIFFEDRGMRNASRQFDTINEPVTEAEIIEVLSSAELIDEAAFEMDQQSLFEVSSEQEVAEPKLLTEETKPDEDSLLSLYQADEEFEDEGETEEEFIAESELQFKDEPAEKQIVSGEFEIDEEVESADEPDEDFPFSLDDEVDSQPENLKEEEVSGIFAKIDEEEVLEIEQDEPEFSLADIFISDETESEDEELQEKAVENSTFVTEESSENPADTDEVSENDKKTDKDDSEDPGLAEIYYKDPETEPEEEESSENEDTELIENVDEEDSEPEEKPEEGTLAAAFLNYDESEFEKIDTVPEEEVSTENEDTELIENVDEEDSEPEGKPEESTLAAAYLNRDESEFEKIETETEREDPPFILDETDETDETIDEEPLLKKFSLDIDDDPDEEPHEFIIKPKTIYDELNLSKKEDKKGKVRSLFDFDTMSEVDLDKTDAEENPAAPPAPENETEESNDPEEVPMWKSFLERGDIDHEPGFVFDEQPVQIDEDIYPDEPLIDLTKEEPELSEKISDISGWLDDDSSRFIDEIFGGSDAGYEEALGNIVDFNNWKDASRYIEKEIFTRNMIDVYDEVAVDFTDRLHSYFTEHKT